MPWWIILIAASVILGLVAAVAGVREMVTLVSRLLPRESQRTAQWVTGVGYIALVIALTVIIGVAGYKDREQTDATATHRYEEQRAADLSAFEQQRIADHRRFEEDQVHREASELRARANASETDAALAEPEDKFLQRALHLSAAILNFSAERTEARPIPDTSAGSAAFYQDIRDWDSESLSEYNEKYQPLVTEIYRGFQHRGVLLTNDDRALLTGDFSSFMRSVASLSPTTWVDSSGQKIAPAEVVRAKFANIYGMQATGYTILDLSHRPSPK